MIKLSPHETTIVKHICDDLPCKDIAGAMGICARTIGVHKYNIRKKMGVKGDIGIYKKAVELGIVPAPAMNLEETRTRIWEEHNEHKV